MQRVEFGDHYRDRTNAVFLAIYVDKISPWKYFNDDIKHMICPAMIMIDRWDGRMGFPGGTVDAGENLLDALVREVKEEIGITVKADKVRPVATHLGKIATHLFALEVLEIEFLHIYYHILSNFSRSILLHAYEEGDKSHFMSEITGIKIVPIFEHKNKGINLFLQNSFAGSARDEILIMLSELFNLDIEKFKNSR